MALIFTLLVVHFDCTILSSKESGYYSVISSPSNLCHKTEQCLTLSQFANDGSSEYLSKNTTLQFLQGEHSLDSTVLIENINIFYISSESYDSNVTIICNHSSARFEFNNVSIVHISGLTFIGCTGNKFINISQFTLEDSQFIGQKSITGTALELVETSAVFVRTEFSHNYGNKVAFVYCNNVYPPRPSDYSNQVTATAGGAITSTHSNVTIIGSAFERNSAQVGGAIFAELQSNITMIKCTFIGNQAIPLQSYKYCYAGGGVLYSDNGSSVEVQNSKFEHNTAHWHGGIMALGSHSNITITNSYFISNSVHYFGGVLSSDSYSSITITNGSKFTNNSADAGGVLGLSFADHLSVTVTIIDSEFTDNRVNNGGGVLDLAGAIYSSIIVNHSKFTNNSASLGGVLSLPKAHHSSISISNSNFTHNSASDSGGIISLSESASSLLSNNVTITITDNKFTSNSVDYRGGVFDLFISSHSNITITINEFTDNSAMYGGVLYLLADFQSNISITNSQFTDNSASYSGGVMSGGTDSRHSVITLYTIVIITNNIFTNNNANFSGGVLCLSLIQSSSITITDSEFNGNRAQEVAGVLDVSDAENNMITIYSSNFTNNIASQGGILYCRVSNYGKDTQNIIGIIASRFINNTVHDTGGVLNIKQTNMSITQSAFVYNKAIRNGGTIYMQGGTLIINCSNFHHNMANFGGVLWALQANINYSCNTSLSHNRAYTDGGVIYAQQSTAVITGADFDHNRADNNGGTMYTYGAMISLINCIFSFNIAGNDGGVIRSYLRKIDISENEYTSNSANNKGGVFCVEQTDLAIDQTLFTESTAWEGGVIWTDQGAIMINQSAFSDNNASTGGVIRAEQANINADRVNITYNRANVGVLYLLESNSDWSGILYSDNIGSLHAIGGEVTTRNNNTFINITQPNYGTASQKEGGAITAIHSEIIFNGNSLLTQGHAELGGSLKAINSKIQVYGNVTIAENTATEAGGGMYLKHSELICWKGGTLMISNNKATKKGGGINAFASVIKVKYPPINQSFLSLHFYSNQAMKGGGLFLEMDSKVYILKSKISTSKQIIFHQTLIFFSLNFAQYGGAIYVSNDGICSLSNKSTANECFIQILAMYSSVPTDFDSRYQNIDFVNNTANYSGNSLFGGLLDRCSVSQFAETNVDNTISNGTIVVKGYRYFQKISNIQDVDIGSYPVRVCFCNNGQPDCSYEHDPIQIIKGQQGHISLSLAVVNQISVSLHQTKIHSHLNSENYLCQDYIQSVDDRCRNVSFATFSYNDSDELILSFKEGPCKDQPESKARVMLEFYCPQCLIGFELNKSGEGCQCICDSTLFPYFTNCSGETLVRDTNVWVTNLTIYTTNTSDIHQYLIHPYCPFDYCHPPSSRVKINLNIPNGADAQCANHRVGLLCGLCQHNYSLSLGSSHCLPCSTHWYAVLIAILIAAVLAGIILVALLLALNLTVAIGTLNGIIFYANIVYANNSTFLPFTEPKFNFITAFISWLNLEIGFDACFFIGMDAYSKILLQLAFPGYVFFLVFMVIIISKHSMRFSKLIGKRNPIATLATLISLSYAKFLQIIIASLSVAILKYPDGSRTYVWLVDASVGYLTGKHIALFVIAFLIIIVGICYNALLLFWQWLLRCQDKAVFMWVKYQKLCLFIEPYHAPYVDKHRYWAGLLFLIRVVLYIVFALNVNGDPRITLVAIILTVGGLLLIKGFLVKVYKKWPIDVMESIMYFNILGLAALTWYCIGAPQRQTAVVYTSVTIALLFLLMIIGYHMYKFTVLGYVIQKIEILNIFKVLAAKLLNNKKEMVRENSAQNLIEHEQMQQEEREISFTVVEVPKPIFEHAKPEAHIQWNPHELLCYTPPNTLGQQ